MRKFFEEFKEFALKGNMLDLSIGVIIGGAFQAVVSSLTSDIISPIIGIFAKTNFDNLAITFWDVNIKYGAFITALINFLIMALVIFLMLKGINKLTGLRKKQEELVEEATTKTCPYCCSEIPVEASRCPHCTSILEAK
ncbi:MAG: large conductance mechanosensitive channel protein MscL [Eubacterium sp.]|nr:large conductance mechanosensitive channel protein MscL [Eubacterium sp.]